MADDNRDALHVFISYLRRDAAVVDEIVAAIDPQHPTWRDTSDMLAGQAWREEVASAIRRSYALVLVISEKTEDSKEVYVEYFFAQGLEVPVIPLLVEDCALPFDLGNVNARFWHHDRDAALRHLTSDLDAYRDEPPDRPPAGDVSTYLDTLRLDYLMNVGNYTPMLGTVRKRARREAAPPRPVVMRSTFTLRRSGPLQREEAQVEEMRDYAELLPALRELKQAVLLGEPGIGKTTTLYKFADELCQTVNDGDQTPIPVMLPLREWKGGANLESFIARQLGTLAGRYRELLGSGRLHLLCDGLNEIDRDEYRDSKVEALRTVLASGVPSVVTCRELDYRDAALRLDLDAIEIHPLAPSRVHEFLQRYLVDAFGEEAGTRKADALFWQIAGGDEVRGVWETWRGAGASLDQFFESEDIPRKSPDVYTVTTRAEDETWRRRVCTSSSLVRLAANPYMLWMFLGVYRDLGHIPGNRGGLFDEFVFHLLKREDLTAGEALTEAGQDLRGRLEALAWKLQRRSAGPKAGDGGVELTLPRREALKVLGDEQRLHQAASANLLDDADPVRFTHQLLQEYFSACRLRTEIEQGLEAEELWPRDRWWQPSGWEESVVLAAGLSDEAATQVFDWVLPSNPEVAAACILRSGRYYDDDKRSSMRWRWLGHLTDVGKQPQQAARAAIGRALGSVRFLSDELVDNREGVGVDPNGVPDFDWIPIGGGRVVLEGDAGEQTVGDFQIARFPVTVAQFQTFLDAEDGFDNGEWWADLEQKPPRAPRWSEANGPRETVSWHDAVAFSRWLSRRLGYTVRLPTEFEWQQAATGGQADREFPWGAWEEGRCNSSESGLNRTTAVGLYPHGTWEGGPEDMAGNVWEWCLNKYKEPADNEIDRSGDNRVLRGGSWYFNSAFCRAAFRFYDPPDYRNGLFGFRLLRPPSPDH